jgi:hypothetical protein
VLIFNNSSLLSSLIASRQCQTDHCLPDFRRKTKGERPHILHVFYAAYTLAGADGANAEHTVPDGDGETDEIDL